MKKNIVSMLFSVCCIILSFSVKVHAEETIRWENIIGMIGSSEEDLHQNGWTYYAGSNSIIIDAGITVDGDVTVSQTIINNGILLGGIFTSEVTNNFQILGGTFYEQVINNVQITGGTFTGNVINNGIIQGGIFRTNPTGNPTGNGVTIDPNLGIGSNNPDNGDGRLEGDVGDDDTENVSSGENSNVDKSSHVHSFHWIVTKEPTDKKDGCSSYVCQSCGRVEITQPISFFHNIVNHVIYEIKNAPANGTVTIANEFLCCFSNEMMEELMARPDVTVSIVFVDKGVNYSLTIPAGKAPTDGQQWYGYYYLASLYGWTSVENVR